MMTGQARSSVTIVGLDTHMILETVPVSRSPRRTAHHIINRSSHHYAGTVGKFPSRPILCRIAARHSGSCRYGRNGDRCAAQGAATCGGSAWRPACFASQAAGKK
jgi:hypothetical protein